MATAKKDPSPVERLDEYVDRRAALVKRRFEVEASLPQLRQAWATAAATADLSDDLPAQRAFEQAERELKNVDAALVGIDQKIETTRQEIERAQRAATVALAQRQAKVMQTEAEDMQEAFASFLDHAKRFIAAHDASHSLVKTPHVLGSVAYNIEQQLLQAGFPNLASLRKSTSFSGAGFTPVEAAAATVAAAEAIS